MGGARKYTDEYLIQEALKFETKRDFRIEEPTLYISAKRYKILDLVFKNKTTPKYTDDELIKEGKLYKSRNDFKRGSPKMYSASSRRGFLDKSFKGKPKYAKGNKITLGDIIDAVAQCKTKDDFKSNFKNEYSASQKRGIIHEVSGHLLDAGGTDMNKKCFLYYIKITTLDGTLPDVWKIGITKKQDILTRYYGDLDNLTTKIEILETRLFLTRKLAVLAESDFLKIHKEFRYYGKTPLKVTENTEMFYCDVLNIEQKKRTKKCKKL